MKNLNKKNLENVQGGLKTIRGFTTLDKSTLDKTETYIDLNNGKLYAYVDGRWEVISQNPIPLDLFEEGSVI